MIGDYRPQRHLAAGAGGGGHADGRRDALLDRLRVGPLVAADRAAVRGYHADRLGRIHRAAAAKTDDAVAFFSHVAGAAQVHHRNRRVGYHFVKHHEVEIAGLERRGHTLQQPGLDDAAIGDQHGALHTHRLGLIGQGLHRAQAVFHYGWDFKTNALACHTSLPAEEIVTPHA